MSHSGWDRIAAQASALLDSISSHSTSQGSKASACTEPECTWDALQLGPVDISALRAQLYDLKCSSRTQSKLLSLYTSSVEAMALSCTEAFDSTMRNVAKAWNGCHIRWLESQEVTRRKFMDMYILELGNLGDRLVGEVRSARQQLEQAEDSELVGPKQADPTLASAGVFTPCVNQILFTAFNQFEHLTKGERLALARRTGLREKQVATWFANQRQRRARPMTTFTEEVSKLHLENHSRQLSHPSPPSPHNKASNIDETNETGTPSYQFVAAQPTAPAWPSAAPLTDCGPIFNCTPIPSYERDVSSLLYQIDSSDFSVDSLESQWSQDTPESYYGLPLPPATEVHAASFELPPTEAIEHFNYSPDNSIWNAFDSSFSSSSSSADSYLDDFSFQPPMGAENANPLTCGLPTARQATFAESPSSLGSSPLSTPGVEMDMDADSVISEFGVLTAPSDTGLTPASHLSF